MITSTVHLFITIMCVMTHSSTAKYGLFKLMINLLHAFTCTTFTRTRFVDFFESPRLLLFLVMTHLKFKNTISIL